jgi:hypothetical protein
MVIFHRGEFFACRYLFEEHVVAYCMGRHNGSSRVVLHFKDFKPFFRGKELETAPSLNWNNIRVLSIMCRR